MVKNPPDGVFDVVLMTLIYREIQEVLWCARIPQVALGKYMV